MRCKLVKRPPLHPNCRSVLIPYIKLEGEDSPEDLEEGTGRAAEREDFEKMAADRHNAKVAETGKGKKWKNLSYEYRKYKVYREMDEYQKKTGNRGYKNVPPNTTFEEYFKKQPESFQRNWLGKMKYDAYKAGRLQFKDLVNPRTGYVQSVDELKQAGKIVPLEGSIKPALQKQKQKGDIQLKELTGEAKDYVTKRGKEDEKHLRNLEKIDKKLEQIEQSTKTKLEKDKDIEKLQKELNKIETEHAKKTIESVLGEPKENKTFDIKYKKNHYLGHKRPSEQSKKEVKEVVEDAVRYVQGILDNVGIEYKSEMEVYTSNYGNGHKFGSIHIDCNELGGIVGMPLKFNPFSYTVHEIIHKVVDENIKLKNKLHDFLKVHKTGHDKWENNDESWYLKLDIPMPSYYCTVTYKDKETDYSEELLTMFFTCLCSDTSIRYDMDDLIRTGTDFAQKYPDYFNGMMSILRSFKK